MGIAVDAQTIIEEIDAGQIYPSSRRVSRNLLGSATNLSDLQRRAIAAFDYDPLAYRAVNKELEDAIWATLIPLSYEMQSGLRLAVTLLLDDVILDWEYAEYLIDWARLQGLSEGQIIDAFRQTLKGS